MAPRHRNPRPKGTHQNIFSKIEGEENKILFLDVANEGKGGRDRDSMLGSGFRSRRRKEWEGEEASGDLKRAQQRKRGDERRRPFPRARGTTARSIIYRV